MKKFVLIALVLAIAVTFAFAAFQAPDAGGVALEPQQTVSFKIKPPFPPFFLPIFTPDVGWNS